MAATGRGSATSWRPLRYPFCTDRQGEHRGRALRRALRLDRLRFRFKEELLREIVDNVGKRGTAGQDLQKVISVAMLSEGWDAKNVTHIMGLRAFPPAQMQDILAKHSSSKD